MSMASQAARGKRAQRNHIEKYRASLLGWYDRHRRDLPWRARDGETPDPYAVWLSEIMCQQTTVQAVKPYYLEFLRRWPTVFDLAAAPEEDVMAAWAGLGYYARARNLRLCAGVVASALGGRFPDEQAALMALPGIGEYTSAAIAAIAFNRPATVVDGNVERVVARFFAVAEPLPGVKKWLKDLAAGFFKGFTERPGDLAQAFMDLGAGVCIPKAPRCGICPLRDGCRAHAEGIAASLPVRAAKSLKPQRYGNAYWLEDAAGRVLFHKRPGRGLLAGMVGLPTSEWLAADGKSASAIGHPDWLSAISGKVENTGAVALHTFTHFDLTLFLYRGKLKNCAQISEYGFYPGAPDREISKMPSVFQKAARLFPA